MIDGYLQESVPLNTTARKATVEQLSALACVGLMKDSLVVDFSDFMELEPALKYVTEDEQEKTRRGHRNKQIKLLCDGIQKELKSRLKKLKWRLDLQLAATYGTGTFGDPRWRKRYKNASLRCESSRSPSGVH